MAWGREHEVTGKNGLLYIGRTLRQQIKGYLHEGPGRKDEKVREGRNCKLQLGGGGRGRRGEAGKGTCLEQR